MNRHQMLASESGYWFEGPNRTIIGLGEAWRAEIGFADGDLRSAMKVVREELIIAYEKDAARDPAFVVVPFNGRSPVIAVVPELTEKSFSARAGQTGVFESNNHSQWPTSFSLKSVQ